MSTLTVNAPAATAETWTAVRSQLETLVARHYPKAAPMFRPTTLEACTPVPLGRDANHDPRTGNGGRRWPNTAAGTAAYTTYLETGFYSQLKEFDDDCLRACALVLAACQEGGTHQSIVQHADYAALVNNTHRACIDLHGLLRHIETTFSGSTQGDKLGRVIQACSQRFQGWAETRTYYEGVARRLGEDFPQGSIPLDALLKTALVSATQDPQMEPYIVSLLAETGPSRRLDATFAQLMAAFQQFATESQALRRGPQGAKQQRGKPKPETVVLHVDGDDDELRALLTKERHNSDRCIVCFALSRRYGHSLEACPIPAQLQTLEAIMAHVPSGTTSAQGHHGKANTGSNGRNTDSSRHRNRKRGHQPQADTKAEPRATASKARDGEHGKPGSGTHNGKRRRGADRVLRTVHEEDEASDEVAYITLDTECASDQRGICLTTATSIPRMILDSGASNHIVRCPGTGFTDLKRPKRFGGSVIGPDGVAHSMTATKVGTLPFAPGPVYYAKNAVIDILCLGAFHEAGYGINFPNSRELTLTAPDGKALTFVRGKNYLYYLSELEHDPTLAILATLPPPTKRLRERQSKEKIEMPALVDSDTEDETQHRHTDQREMCAPATSAKLSIDPQPNNGTATQLPPLATALTSGRARRLTVAEQEECDKVEQLHWACGHPSDQRLAVALDHAVLQQAGQLTSFSVKRNRTLRGPCPGCDVGKWREQSAKPSDAAPKGRPGYCHADIIPLASGQLLCVFDEYTEYAWCFFQPSKSAAHCLTSVRMLKQRLARDGHVLYWLRTDPASELLKAAPLIESALPGVKVVHANPEERERYFERHYQTLKAMVVCTIEQLPYQLPNNLHKYLYAYCIHRHNTLPTAATSPLTPAILCGGYRASADTIPFGQAVMVRTGANKIESPVRPPGCKVRSRYSARPTTSPEWQPHPARQRPHRG